MDLLDALCRHPGIEAFAAVVKMLRDVPTEIVNRATSGGASNGSLDA